MAESRVAWQRLDAIFRLEARALVEQLPRHLGIALPRIVEQLATNFPTVDVHTEYLDALFQLEDGSLLHIEFQTTQRWSDLERFLRYAAEIVLRHRPVRPHSIVIYGPGITHAPDGLDYGSLKYTVQNVFLGDQDGEAVLARLQQTLRQGGTLDEDDRLDLVFLSLMRHTRPLAVVFDEAVDVLRQWPEPLQCQTFAGMLSMGYRALTNETLDSLMEKLMSTPIGLRLLNQLLERAEKAEQAQHRLAQAERQLEQAAQAQQQAAQGPAECNRPYPRATSWSHPSCGAGADCQHAGHSGAERTYIDLALTGGSLDEFERGLSRE